MQYCSDLKQKNESQKTKVKFNSIFTFSIMSVKSNLPGFFPPIGDQLMSSKIPWKQIPIHIVTEEWEKSCPRYDYAYQKYLKSAEYKTLLEKFWPLFKYLEKHSGLSVESFGALQYLYNTLEIQNQYQLTYVYLFAFPLRNPKIYEKKYF